MKTRPGNPTADRRFVNFVSTQQLLAEKVRVYYARSARYAFECSEEPLPEDKFDCYVVPCEALRSLFRNRERPDTWLPVVAYGSPQRLSEAFSLGCREYLKEPWDLAELDIRLNNLLRPPAPPLAVDPADALTIAGNKLRSGRAEATLKPNEARILKALLKANGEVVSREVLYYAIWGKIKNASSRVVDVHVSSLRKKLKGLTSLKINQVRGEGYMLS